MGHYAISLKYNFDQNNSDNVITEKFLPFSVNQLLRFNLPLYVMKAFQDMDSNMQYPLDNLVQNNRDLVNSEFIVLLEDDEIREIESNQNDFFEENSDYISIWDLVSEANLIFQSYQFQIGEREDIGMLSHKTEISRYGLLTMRIFVSLLVQLENRRTKRKIWPDDISVDDISFLYDFDKEIGSNFDAQDKANEIEKRMGDVVNHKVKQAYSIANHIVRLIMISNSTYAEDIQREANENAILQLRRQMLQTLWEPYEDEYYQYNVNMAVIRNRRIYRKKDFDSLMHYLQSNALNDTSRMSDNNIIKCVSDTQNSISNICAENYTDIPFDSFTNYFGSDAATKFIKGKYSSGKGTSCFALLITDSNKHYFALSGITEELKRNKGSLKKPVQDIMEKILNKQPVTDIWAQNYKYNFAYIDKSVAVRRYTQIVPDKHINPALYLQQGFETYDKDCINNPTTEYNFTYSCCERKMLAYSGYDHALKIFSRFAPCWKCCPAILDAPNVEVFAFDTLDDFIKNGKVSSHNLKKYEISRNSTYTVKEV